jgi:hypothetical protein
LFHVLPAFEHHTYSEDDVEEGGIKINNLIFLMKIFLGGGRKKGKK